MEHRTCTKCGVSKPAKTEFFRRWGSGDRLRPDCRECSTARDREYYERNKAKVAASRQANAERRAAYQREYMAIYTRTEHGKRVFAEKSARWRQTPQGRIASRRHAQARQARTEGLPRDLTDAEWLACLDVFGYRCAYCAAATQLTRDHVVPVTAGGGFTRSNIIPACLSCNSRKWRLPLGDWYPRQTFFTADRIQRITDYLADQEADTHGTDSQDDH